jgi:hypothetical protein
MRPSCCSIVPVVRQSSARLQASGTGAGAGAGAGVGEPAEPDSEGKARLEGLPFRNHSNRPPPPLKLDSGRASGRCDSLFLRACPIRASQRSLDPHPSLSPPHTHTHLHLLPSRHAQPLCPRPDKTRPKPKGHSNSKRNAHPFLDNLARRAPPLPSLHALHCEIALPATGTPTKAPSVGFAVPHLNFLALSSLSNIACSCCCYLLLLAALPPLPSSCSAMPCHATDDD